MHSSRRSFNAFVKCVLYRNPVQPPEALYIIWLISRSEVAFWPYVMTGVGRRLSRNRDSRISRERFDPESQNFSTNVYTNKIYHNTGYDVTICFRSEGILNILSKMPPPTASGTISREKFKRGSRNFTDLSGTIGPTNLPDMASLAVSGRQNLIKYCTKVRKTGLVGQRVEYSGHCLI